MMKTSEEIRTENLRKLVQIHGGNGKFAEKIGKDQVQVSQWVKNAPDWKTGRQRIVSADSCRHIEKALGLETGWMDHDHEQDDPETLAIIQLIRSLDKTQKKTAFKILNAITESSDDRKVSER